MTERECYVECVLRGRQRFYANTEQGRVVWSRYAKRPPHPTTHTKSFHVYGTRMTRDAARRLRDSFVGGEVFVVDADSV